MARQVFICLCLVKIKFCPKTARVVLYVRNISAYRDSNAWFVIKLNSRQNIHSIFKQSKTYQMLKLTINIDFRLFHPNIKIHVYNIS